jgi:hypothetical protein
MTGPCRRHVPGRERIFAVSAALTIFASAAFAEVVVRSGEHPGHSRLVLEFDRLPDWRLESRPGGYALRFQPPQPAARLDDVFYYIPRDRLADLRVEGDTGDLLLDLACACEVEAVVMRSRALVIDIHDPRPERRAEAQAGTVAAMTDGPISLTAGQVEEPAPDLPDPQSAPDLPTVPETRPQAPVLPFTGNLEPAEAAPLGSGLTRALARELARAAAQGMVEADSGLWRSGEGAEEPGEDGADVTRETAGTDAAGAEAAHETAGADAAPGNIRIRSGFDKGLTPPGDIDLPAVSAELSCPNPALYAVSTWSNGRPPHVQLGALRSRLLGEFDRPDQKTALALARLYVHLTFGTEARSVAEAFLTASPARHALEDLSRLLEYGDAGGALAHYSDCAGDLPLWALLDEDPDAPLRPVNSRAILMAYSGLPPHLRQHLGYRVAARFAARSDYSSAEIVRAALERISGPDEPALVLSTAKTAAVGAESRDTGARLEDLALSLHPEAAEALVLNIDGRLAREERIPLDLVDTAAAISHELEGSDEGARVKSAEIRARLANGDFDVALSELDGVTRRQLLSAEQAGDIWPMAFGRLVGSADDTAFVRHMFRREVATGLPLVGDRTKIALAERLLKLGFPDRAASIVPENATGTDGLFQARVAWARGDAERAITLAERQATSQARRFLAELLARIGRHSEAHAVYAGLEATARGREEAWRAGLWDAVAAGAQADDERSRAAAEMLASLTGEPAPTPDAPPTIGESRELVEQSAGLRDALAELLSAVPPPEG